MNELVRTKGNHIFTDSWIISNGTDNSHEAITKMINKYKSKIEKLGKLSDYLKSSDNSNSEKKARIFLLNEPQATFLMTLLRNNDKVVDFKLKLTIEFFRMRTALLERQSTEWLQTRENGKLIRRKETDALALLKIYAEEQREGKPYEAIYTNYTKLVNEAVGLNAGERNIATFKQLQMISLLEDMIQNTVSEEMQKNVFFKDIYKTCKKKVNTFISLMYLDIKKIA